MRKIREILRLKYAAGLSQRQVAASIGSALSTVQECLRRATQASLTWPLPHELDDAQLFISGRTYECTATDESLDVLTSGLSIVNEMPHCSRGMLEEQLKSIVSG